MQKIIVNIDDPINANLFLKLAESLIFVKSARIEDADDYNWAKPNRPATADECDQMISNALNSTSMTAEEAQEYSLSLARDVKK